LRQRADDGFLVLGPGTQGGNVGIQEGRELAGQLFSHGFFDIAVDPPADTAQEERGDDRPNPQMPAEDGPSRPQRQGEATGARKFFLKVLG
jgi:hypothetical protein